MSAISVERPVASHTSRGDGGFTFVELIVGLMLFAGIGLFLLQAFMNGITYANRSDEKAAATSIAMQVMEQIKGSPDPYTLVNIASIPRTNLPLPAPFSGIDNPTTHSLQASVTVSLDPNLYLATASVNVWRAQDPDTEPLVTFTTVLHQR